MRISKWLMFCIVSVLVVLLAGCLSTTPVPSPSVRSTAAGKKPDEVVVDKEQAAQIVLDTVVSRAHKTLDAQEGLRANQHGELLPAGSTIWPASPGEKHEQMLKCDNACWLFLVDKAPLAHFAHPVEIATVDSVTGEVERIDAEWWPEVNGNPVFDTLESRSDPSQTIYYTPPHGEELDHDIPNEMNVIVQGACPVMDSCETWAILVCGYDDLPDTFDEDTDGMYSVLRDLGVPDDHIFFVSPHTGHDGVDRATSLANVEWAIDQVASRADASDTVLFLYSSHGGVDSLSCVPGSAGGGYLGAAQLDDWLDGINSASLSVVIEACHSGSLIGRYSDGTYVAAEDDLTGEGETNRIVFTSASSDTPSYGDLDGADDPNPGDAGSETIWGYVEAFITASADADNDAHMSVDEAHQYAWDNDVSRIRGMNTPQLTSTGIAEADTYNYCQCEPMADLIIESISHEPATPTTVDMITFNVVVKNVGLGAAGPSSLSFRVGGETTPEVYSIPALEADETYTVQRQEQLGVAQAYRNTIIVDVNNDVPESNEANNQQTDRYTVAAPSTSSPDLVIETLTHSPDTPTTSDEITFVVVVKNVGAGSAGSSTLSFRIGGESTPPMFSVPNLAPGETYTIQRRLTLGTAQSYQSTVTVDVNNDVPESNEANNQQMDRFSVVEP
jgi:hypothetical protein